MSIHNYFSDCYVLVNTRDKKVVLQFLNHFLSEIIELSDKYEIPQYSKNHDQKLISMYELLEFLENKNDEPYYISWKGLLLKDFPFKTVQVCPEEIKSIKQIVENHFLCMATYTNDGKMILGISCPTMEPDTRIEDYYFSKLKEFANSEIGYITYEQPATNNSAKFTEIAEKWSKDRTYWENIND